MTLTTTQPDRTITIGVDTHSLVHHAAALDSMGQVLGDRRFSTDVSGYQELLDWAAGFGIINAFGVECTGSYGAELTRHLLAAGVDVVEVNRGHSLIRSRSGKLVGLVLNSTLGWSWADAGAALVIAAIAVREGINAWRGEVCCTVSYPQDAPDAETDDCCSSPETGAGRSHGGGRADSDARVTPRRDAEEAETSGCCEGCGSSPEPKTVSLSLGPRNG